MLFEGARLITGDGKAPIENLAFIVDNIANTRRIHKVYLRGPEVDRAALRAAWTGRS